ncbi:MAG: glycosyltransferase family 4 protein, partial [Bacteroidales bacterium]|nr:glycosyltransferase family 4 protein [Bacteroidales bacterium]
MRIAVNTRLILKNKLEGIGWFTYETMSRMAAQHPEHDFIFIFDRPVHPDFKFSENVKTVVAGPQTRHPILWYLWFEWVIPRVLKKHKADLFISPDAYASLRTKVPTITVIHDLNFVHHPEYLPKIVEKYYNYFVPKFIKHSVRIGTVSEYSKKDIIKAYNTDADKIDVYYNGSNNYYSPVSDEVKTETKSKFSREKDYFLFVGALNPRKNIPGLLKSYEKYREKAGRNNLLIVGSAMHKTEEIDACLKEMKYSEDVIFTGRLSVEDLSKVMSSAQALV